MNLSISNIAWTSEQDAEIYTIMKAYGFKGLEIAPTRIFSERPYDMLIEAKDWSIDLKDNEGFVISSMQSIWFGQQERIFGCVEERQALVNYTKKAIDFAEAISCSNLVFGCPRNRCIPEGADENIAIEFFKELAEYAYIHNTVLAIEANPPIYNTNYINTTEQAYELMAKVNSNGFKVNLDVGAMIENNEQISLLKEKVKYINHVHISEPGLKMIESRRIHAELASLLIDEGYTGFVSIEMGKQEENGVIEQTCTYVKEVFM